MTTEYRPLLTAAWTDDEIGAAMVAWNRVLKNGGLPSEAFRAALNAGAGRIVTEVDALHAELARVRSAAKMGMDAAHAIGTHDLALGRRLQAESKPEAVASEREANARLTEMLEAAEARTARLEEALEALALTADGIGVPVYFADVQRLRDATHAARAALGPGGGA